VGSARVGVSSGLEQLRAHADDSEARHAGGHGVVAHPFAGLVQVCREPGAP
jgi:hypothetical protein